MMELKFSLNGKKVSALIDADSLLIDPQSMVAQSSFQYPAAVVSLAGDHVAGNYTAAGIAVGNAVLLPPEKHIALGHSVYPGEESSIGRHEGELNAALGTFAHQGRGCTSVGEGDDAFQIQQREPGCNFVATVDNHIAIAVRKKQIFAGDVERVKQLSHVLSSNLALM